MRNYKTSHAENWVLSRSLALVLCLLCYFFGRYLHVVPKPAVAPPPHIPRGTHSQAGQLTRTTEVGPSELTKLVEKSGILQSKPPITPGSTGNPSYTTAPFQVLSWQPRLFLFPSFVDEARCNHIISLAQSQVTPSEVEPTLSDKEEAVAGASPEQQRTSSGAFFDASEDPDGVLAWLEERIAAVTQLPVEHGEAFNILRYQNDQYYESHLDAFDPDSYGPQQSQRVATMLIILRAPEEGGETVFKKEGRGGADREVSEWRQCLEGEYMYKPRQGDALLFYATTPAGKIDQQALHGACPVRRGEKWVATKWIRNKPV